MNARIIDAKRPKRRATNSRAGLRSSLAIAVAGTVVLLAQTPVAEATRPELEFELTRNLLERVIVLETEELASMRPISPPAERGGRLFTDYQRLKQFSTGVVARSGARLAPEIAYGDGMMLTALSGLPADFHIEPQRLTQLEKAGPYLDTVDRAMAQLDDEDRIAASGAPAEPQGTASAALGYAPAGKPLGADRFDMVLKPGDGAAFIPPIGENDHAWAATPLSADAFGEKEQECLAKGIYFEARGESETGQAAVAQVILNRVRNPAYPDTICKVVYQNRNWRNRCQFSFACDGRADRITNKRAYERARRIAMEVTKGEIWLPEVGSATHYHATYVRPRWARAMEKVDKIGLHVFYRTEHGGWN